VRASPRAGATHVAGIAAEADGGTTLKVAVTAVPEGGKANAALLRMLAKEWGLPKSTMSITGGVASQRKTLFVSGDSGELMTRLKRWLEDKL
jgi:hypothetical protein